MTDTSCVPDPSAARWLPVVVTLLGAPDKDPDLARWTWQDGEVGVFIDRLTHVWQSVAWTTHRSVTLRSLDRPGDRDMLRVVALAGLCDDAAPVKPGPTP